MTQPTLSRRTKVIGSLATLAGLASLPLGMLWHNQDAMIFPQRHESTPVTAQGAWKVADLDLKGIGRIQFLFGDPGQVASEAEPGPVILFLHGNGSSAGMSAMVCDDFRATGCPVVVAEYPGYSGNPGQPSEAALQKAASATAVWARSRWPGRKLCVMGESIGTAPAVFLAVQGVADLLVLDSPFTSMGATISALMPWLPFVDLLNRHPMDSIGRLRGAAGMRLPPSLVLVSAADPIVPIWMGQEIANALPGCQIHRSPMPGHPVLALDKQARIATRAFIAAVMAKG